MPLGGFCEVDRLKAPRVAVLGKEGLARGSELPSTCILSELIVVPNTGKQKLVTRDYVIRCLSFVCGNALLACDE